MDSRKSGHSRSLVVHLQFQVISCSLVAMSEPQNPCWPELESLNIHAFYQIAQSAGWGILGFMASEGSSSVQRDRHFLGQVKGHDPSIG